ncbi:MAG: hypothetical protein PHV05_01195 [Candidatus Riflebacteria bacterium]|nr:hypothetical protein [Candidatus Riflebacteria bacterium]
MTLATTGKKTKKQKDWKPEEESKLSRLQKGIIAAAISFIPFLFLVILPIMARENFSSNLIVSRDIFLSAPEQINLSSSEAIQPTFKLNIKGVEFKIPDTFTPVRITDDSVEFRIEPRHDSKCIYVCSRPYENTIKYAEEGLARWFMPTSLQEYVEKILNATWHPIRLMFKAQFFASEGITGKIYQADWDANHHGYIFPVKGDRGYLGRIFRDKNQGYFEFLVADSIHHVSLQEWMNLAIRIKPPLPSENETTASISSDINFLTEEASIPAKQNQILSFALSGFFKTSSVEWLIPVARVMQQRKFYPELLDMHKQFFKDFSRDETWKAAWKNMFDSTVKQIITTDIDPENLNREIKIYCKNLTALEIGQVWLRITVKSTDDSEKSFVAPLLKQSRLIEDQEKEIFLQLPEDISLANKASVYSNVVQIDFIR